ncbi:MAG: hypothetical protein ABIQ06_00550, partial [Caldimonas sp.]
GETDNYDERARGYAVAQRIVAKDLPYWWLVETVVTSAWRSRFQGFQPWSGEVAERAWLRP